MQMSRGFGSLGNEASNLGINRSDCIFMGNILTVECWIIDRNINARGAAVNGFNTISGTQNVSAVTLRV